MTLLPYQSHNSLEVTAVDVRQRKDRGVENESKQRCPIHHRRYTHVLELSFRHPVSVHDYSDRLVVSGSVELDHQIAHHIGKIADDLFAMLLNSHGRAVARRVSVHAADNLVQKVKVNMVGSGSEKVFRVFVCNAYDPTALVKKDVWDLKRLFPINF